MARLRGLSDRHPVGWAVTQRRISHRVSRRFECPRCAPVLDAEGLTIPGLIRSGTPSTRVGRSGSYGTWSVTCPPATYSRVKNGQYSGKGSMDWNRLAGNDTCQEAAAAARQFGDREVDR